MPFPLIPLVTAIAPGLIGHLFGNNAGEVVQKVTDAAVSIFGTDDKTAIEQSIAKDPGLALAFKSKLLEIQDNESQRQHAERMEEIGDKDKARNAFKDNPWVLGIGAGTILLFFLCCGGVLYGCFQIMTEGIKIKDPGTVAVVFSTLGMLIGLIATQAGMVYQFLYGSNRNSEQKTDVFAAQLQDLSKALANSKPAR